MLKMEEWLLIRDLYSQGFSISKIARQTGYARETVRKYLNKKTAPEPQKRPGRKSKLDLYKPYILEKLKKLFCFNMILGYSRMRYVEFTLSIDTPTLIQCHLNAFEYFGGFTQEILYDNMKQVVIKRALKASDSEWNSQFEDFFKYYGFIPRLCRPYRPQTKGKIENTVGCQEGFLPWKTVYLSRRSERPSSQVVRKGKFNCPRNNLSNPS